jgi:hypothetical protein
LFWGLEDVGERFGGNEGRHVKITVKISSVLTISSLQCTVGTMINLHYYS